MKFRVLRKPAWSQVIVEGPIQTFHTKVVRESVIKLIDDGFTNVILDLSKAVQPLRTNVFTAIAQLFITSRLAGGISIVVSPGEKFLSRLAATGLEAFIHIVKTPDLALQCLLAAIPKRYDKPFFQQLIAKGILREEELRETIARYKSQQNGKLFGDILIEQGYVNVEQLLDLLAVSMGLDENSRLPDADTDMPQPVIPGTELPSEGAAVPTGTAGSIETPASPAPPAPLTGAAAEFTGPVEPQTFEPFESSAPDSTGSTDELNLALPQGSAPVEPSHTSEFVTKKLFGDILVEQGLITEGQLRKAIEIKNQRAGVRLGDILIEEGFIGTDEVLMALKSQIRRRNDAGEDVSDAYDDSAPGASKPQAPSSMVSEFVKPTLFGEILLELGLVKESQLREALDYQRTCPEKQLGNILVELGFVSPQAILRAAEEQVNRQR